MTTPLPEESGFLEHAGLSPTTFRSTGPVRASRPCDREPGHTSRWDPVSGETTPVPSEYRMRLAGAKLLFRVMSPVYRSSTPASRYVPFYHHTGAAIPPSA